ncbi:MAG: hypothetical protein KatS3mg110_0354 [Pirellulaceae bacterium]|nr:MAG: hypothetical protein KatS3mg110_0354 [Pirellulaceae bacterium]
MEPLISIRQHNARRIYHPGELLVCDYQIDAVEPEALYAVEASVLWYTEGKGEEDLGVHFFQRRTKFDAEEGDLRQLHRFQTVLPRSPLSYYGVLFRIIWCVRVRVFLPRGRQYQAEQTFQLGPLHTAYTLCPTSP